MADAAPGPGGWTTETLARAIQSGDTFRSPVPGAAVTPSPLPPAEQEPALDFTTRLVRRIRRPLGRIRRALSRWSHPQPVRYDGRLHLLYDIQGAQGPSAGRGIGRYTHNLLHGLAAVRPSWRIEAVAVSNFPIIPGTLPESVPCSVFHPPAPDDIWGEENDLAYADWLLGHGADAILLTDLLTPPVRVPTFRSPSPPLFAVLHDLIPLLFPPHYLTCPVYLPHYVRRLRTMLDGYHVLSNSQCTADDWARVFGLKGSAAVNIRGAVDGQFRPGTEAELVDWRRAFRERYGVDGEFLLYVGGPDYRKNLKGAVRAFAKLPAERQAGLKLLIACHLSDGDREDVLACVQELGVTERVVLTGRITDEELVALYRLTRVFVFPSLYEGLGFPLVEALGSGCPVVCGNNSSLPEYAGPWTHMADASDPAAFARAIEAALDEPRDLHQAERIQSATRFTWTDTAERAATVIEQVTAGRTARGARRAG